jgi:hypothetical protein
MKRNTEDCTKINVLNKWLPLLKKKIQGFTRFLYKIEGFVFPIFYFCLFMNIIFFLHQTALLGKNFAPLSTRATHTYKFEQIIKLI